MWFHQQVHRSIIISDCIEGWKYFHHTKYCYKHFPYHVRYSKVWYNTVQHFPHHVRFTDALAICSLATGGEGNLASAHDSETLSFFEGLASLKKRYLLFQTI